MGPSSPPRLRPAGHARAGGADVVVQLLRQAAGRASDPAVRLWLTALLRHGESAAGRIDHPGAGQAAGGRP
jgi:hypothetical protein